jgi:hypothetical protein
METPPHGPPVALAAVAASLVLATTACGGGGSTNANAIVVPSADATPPTTAWLQANIPNRPFANVYLGSASASSEMGENDTVVVTARGDDLDGGVQDVQIWASTTLYRARAGVVAGPSLSGTPMASNPSSAKPGDTASKDGSAAWTFSVPSLMTGYDGIKVDLHADVVNFHGGTAKTATLTLRFQRKDLGLHVVALSDSDGGHASSVTATDFAALVGRLNNVYNGTGIRFLFDPATDFTTRQDTQLNQQQSGWVQTAEQITAANPGSIVLFLRWGSDPQNRTGNGNAYPPPGVNPLPLNMGDVTQDFVMLPNLLDGTLNFLNLDNGSFMAHELGHYLGLYHTHPGWGNPSGPLYNGNPSTQAALDQQIVDYIAANGGTIDALDGDAVSSTPPDPGPIAYQRHNNQDFCTNPSLTVTGTSGGQQVSYTFAPDRTNVMGYYKSQDCNSGSNPPPQTFTFQQIQRMQNALTKPPRNALWP